MYHYIVLHLISIFKFFVMFCNVEELMLWVSFRGESGRTGNAAMLDFRSHSWTYTTLCWSLGSSWPLLQQSFGYMHHGKLVMHLLVDAKHCSIAFRSHHCSWLRTNLLVYGWCFVFTCYLHVAKQNFFSFLTSRVVQFYTCFLPQH